MSRAEWSDAFAAAEEGRPAKLAALVRSHGVPQFALERCASYIAASKFPKRSPRAEELANAFEHFHANRKAGLGDREAFNHTLKTFELRESVLDNVLARTRQDVNRELRKRGSLNLAD